MPHPNLVPVRPRASRQYQSSGIDGSPSYSTAAPFTVSLVMGHLETYNVARANSVLPQRSGIGKVMSRLRRGSHARGARCLDLFGRRGLLGWLLRAGRRLWL